MSIQAEKIHSALSSWYLRNRSSWQGGEFRLGLADAVLGSVFDDISFGDYREALGKVAGERGNYQPSFRQKNAAAMGRVVPSRHSPIPSVGNSRTLPRQGVCFSS